MSVTKEDAILIVNDESDQLDLMGTLLRGAGYRVLEARDGLAGFEAAKSERPRLVVSDVSMPGLDGIELCRRIRADADLRLVPVLLVSAHRRDAVSAVEGLRAGADDYLEAPYAPTRLIAQVARLVERARSEAALRESEERYRLLFDSNPQPMWVYDIATLRFLAVNDAAVRHYGYTRAEFLSMTIRDIRPPEDVPTLMEAVAGITEGLNPSGVWRHRRKDETVIEVEITSRPFVFIGRHAELVLAHNITERRAAEEALRKSEEHLRQVQKLEAVGCLAGGVAHDFNNVLTAILGYSQLALRCIREDDPSRRYLEEIKRSALRAASLTQQLLAFSRKQVLQPVVLDLNHVVSDMEQMLRRLIGEDVDLVTALDPALGRVKADPSQIEQVLMNLAVNARDAIPRGGKLTVETQNVHLDAAYARSHVSVRPGRYVMLAVSDTGTGMDDETRRHIFEPFFTTKEIGKGTGLGLSTVYGIVKQSGGNIWVYSEPGHGTSFKIYLPLVEDEAQVVPVAPTPEAARGTETVLVVDDDEMVRNLAREALELEGYTVLTARDGCEALALCRERRAEVDLLITDVVMPEMSGRELAERLADECPGARVLYMSGYTDDAVVRHGVLEAGTHFLQKPFTPGGLARKVREVLDGPDEG
ncbi:MAG: response regulator [Acidobacteriota bacterium]|nr:response regulator [Acidobacteriota bacterium]